MDARKAPLSKQEALPHERNPNEHPAAAPPDRREAILPRMRIAVETRGQVLHALRKAAGRQADNQHPRREEVLYRKTPYRSAKRQRAKRNGFGKAAGHERCVDGSLRARNTRRLRSLAEHPTPFRCQHLRIVGQQLVQPPLAARHPRGYEEYFSSDEYSQLLLIAFLLMVAWLVGIACLAGGIYKTFKSQKNMLAIGGAVADAILLFICIAFVTTLNSEIGFSVCSVGSGAYLATLCAIGAAVTVYLSQKKEG